MSNFHSLSSRFRIFACGWLLLLSGGCSNDVDGNAAKAGAVVTAVNLDTVFVLNALGSTDVLTRSAVDGKVVYLDFWASWCAPCIQSMPVLSDLSSQYSDSEFVLISVNLDTDIDKALAFIDKLSVEFPVFHDPSSAVMKEYKVTGLPTGILINAGSEVVLTHRGFSPKDEAFLRALIDREVRRRKLYSQGIN